MEERLSYQLNTSQTGTEFRTIKRKRIELNNARENKSRIPHEYEVGDMTLTSRNKKSKQGEREKDGPYPIVQVNNNGTVRYDKGSYSDIINIRKCEPFQA